MHILEPIEEQKELGQTQREKLAQTIADNFHKWDEDRNSQITVAKDIMQEVYLNQPRLAVEKDMEWKSDVKLNALYNSSISVFVFILFKYFVSCSISFPSEIFSALFINFVIGLSIILDAKIIITAEITTNETYTVKSGDSLYSIAKRYGTSVEEIKKLNYLTSNISEIPSKKNGTITIKIYESS